MEENDNEVPPVTFFSKRAKFIPQEAAKELLAAAELLNKEEKNKCSFNDNKKPLPTKKNKRASKRQKSAEAIKIIDEIEGPSSPEVRLSAPAIRRLKKLQKEQDLELKRIEAANEEILSAINTSICEQEEIILDDFDKVVVLTISYLSKVLRLKCYEQEKFSTIFPKVADFFKLKVSEFLLCLRDQNISVDDTPKSLNIANIDIIECIPYKTDRNTKMDFDVDKLKITFQSSDRNKTEMLVHKLENMQDVMERYSKTCNIPIEQLIFEFDGEPISGTETPEDMDMESGNCIDVKVLTAGTSSKTSRKEKEVESVITIESDASDCDVIPCD